ncbi:MAG: hypothetical protein ACOY6N_05950 [Pseudomonadota bacterium]
MSSDSTAAIVAIEGNQTVGVFLPDGGSGSPGRRIPTTQRFISDILIGMAYVIHFINVAQLQPAFMNELGYLIEQRLNGVIVNHHPELPMNAKQTALDAYLARTAAIHAKLERLQQLADDHFGHDPDAIHWGHVGDLGRVEAGLDELLTIFGGDGE